MFYGIRICGNLGVLRYTLICMMMREGCA